MYKANECLFLPNIWTEDVQEYIRLPKEFPKEILQKYQTMANEIAEKGGSVVQTMMLCNKIKKEWPLSKSLGGVHLEIEKENRFVDNQTKGFKVANGLYDAAHAMGVSIGISDEDAVGKIKEARDALEDALEKVTKRVFQAGNMIEKPEESKKVQESEVIESLNRAYDCIKEAEEAEPEKAEITRAKEIVGATAWMMRTEGKNILALDTETTGFTKEDEVLQLSIVDGTGKVVFNEYFRPDHKTEWKSAEMWNHISPESVKDKPTIMERKKAIEALLNKADLIVGYNLGYDLRMLSQNGIDVSPEKERCVDVMTSFARQNGERNQYGSFKWKKLAECAKAYDYPENEWHEASADTKATLYCFKEMANRGHFTPKDLHTAETLANFREKVRTTQKTVQQSVQQKPKINFVISKPKSNDRGMSR